MRHILLPALDQSSVYAISFTGDRWSLWPMSLDSRSALGEYVARFGPLAGHGVDVELSANVGLVPGMQTVLTVLDTGTEGGDES